MEGVLELDYRDLGLMTTAMSLIDRFWAKLMLTILKQKSGFPICSPHSGVSNVLQGCFGSGNRSEGWFELLFCPPPQLAVWSVYELGPLKPYKM